MVTIRSARASAAVALAQVLDAQRSLTDVLATTMRLVAPRDRALTQELCYGVLRHGFLLDQVLRSLMQRPLAEQDPRLRSLLLCGLYQLAYLKTPPHAAVSETVAAAAELGFPWAKGFVNGVLRSFQRDPETLMKRAAQDDPAADLGHPAWWVAALQTTYPAHWRLATATGNTRPPLVLRVNRRRITPTLYLAELLKVGIAAFLHAVAPDAVVLEEPRTVEDIPGFREGLVSVQDAAAQLAAPLLDPLPGNRILDACAAPGGKTGHLLESLPLGCTVWALDRENSRQRKIEENLLRLGLNAHTLTGDATVSAEWWDGHLFDRILLDAPCSASGIVRRHPDIKWLRRATDLPRLAEYQKGLLHALWPLLAPGGVLLYTTCSVFPTENECVLQTFLADNPDAQEKTIAATWGNTCTLGRQIVPGQEDMDGFYYARITKSPQ